MTHGNSWREEIQQGLTIKGNWRPSKGECPASEGARPFKEVDAVTCWILTRRTWVATSYIPRRRKGPFGSTLANKRTRDRGLPSKKTLHSISEVEKSHHTAKPSREPGPRDKDKQKRHRYEWNTECTRQTHFKNCSIEIGTYAKWIHSVAPNPSLKIPQFVLYSGQTHPL